MAPTGRRTHLILSYLVLAVNNVLLLLGLGVVGLSGNMLYWINGSNDSDTTYVLDPNALPPFGAPASPNIKQYPTGFRLLGTQFILAAGIPVVIVAAMTIALIFVFSIRPVKHGFAAPDYTFRFSILIHVSFITAVFLTSTLVISWLEYYTTPKVVFTLTTVSNSTYSLATQTPESWLQTLSSSIAGYQNQKPLHNLSILATTGRILTIPTLVLEVISLVVMLMLRKRMKTNTSRPLRRHLHMEKIRESLLEQAHSDRNSSRNSGILLKNPADEYTSMVQEVAETTRVWRLDAFTAYQPGRVEELVDSPITMDTTSDREGRAGSTRPALPPPLPEWNEELPPAIPPRSERRKTISRERGRPRHREVTETTGLVDGERDIVEMSRYDGWEMADDLRVYQREAAVPVPEYRPYNDREWRR